MKKIVTIFALLSTFSTVSFAEPKCSIEVDSQVKIVDPPIRSDKNCQDTNYMTTLAAANAEAEVLTKVLIRECQYSHIDCVISENNYSGGNDYASGFERRVCVTGTKAKNKTLSPAEVLSKQCQLIDKCFQNALNDHDEKLYQMAKDLFVLKNCNSQN